jgi:hypothetical protein
LHPAAANNLGYTLHGPSDWASTVFDPASIDIEVTGPDGTPIEVVLHGRRTVGERDFRVVLLPDTQYYVSSQNGGRPTMFNAQTEWIVANRKAANIAFVLHMGDITQDGDLVTPRVTNEPQWQLAAKAMYLLEDPVSTGLAEGIPYGVVTGNHDMSPAWRSWGTTNLYNKYFGYDHFKDKSYYGGRYGTVKNDNYYQLYEVGDLKFISISLGYHNPSTDTTDYGILEWADNILKAYADRIGIVVTHHTISTNSAWGPYAQIIYEVLKDNPNFRLFLGGHITGEATRTDTYQGNRLITLLQDYQGWTNGGNGYLRIMTMSPRTNIIRLNTYSPYIDTHLPERDLALPFDFGTQIPAFTELHRETVDPGSRVRFDWAGVDPSQDYEWYAVISAGEQSLTTARFTFTGSRFVYDHWRAARFAEVDPSGDPEADPDNDGYVNYLEFLLDSDPLDPLPGANMPTATFGPGSSVVTLRRAITTSDTWLLQVSANLTEWLTPAAAGITVLESIEPDDDMESVRLEIENPADAPLFWRFVVE